MAVSTPIKITTFENVTKITEYNFGVFSNNGSKINDVTVYVDEEDDNNGAYVWYHDTIENYTSIQMFFATAAHAHHYAEKTAKKLAAMKEKF